LTFTHLLARMVAWYRTKKGVSEWILYKKRSKSSVALVQVRILARLKCKFELFKRLDAIKSSIVFYFLTVSVLFHFL